MIAPRWSLGGYARVYSWPQCRYCGCAQGHDCPRVQCLLCGTAQCFGNGSGNGQCSICHHGYLPGWSRSVYVKQCGYAGCESEAVAIARRKPVCLAHAGRIKVHKGMTLSEYVSERTNSLAAGTLKVGLTPWRLVD